MTLALLVWLRARVPQPAHYEQAGPLLLTADNGPATDNTSRKTRLPRAFWVYSGFTAMTMVGFATFGLLSFHMVKRGLLPAPIIPVLYAAVMAMDALAALVTGWAYDRYGPRILLTLPVVAAAIPALAFADALAPVIAGSLLWGAAQGIQESTLRASIADLIEPHRRSTAYGIFAAILGVATAAGATLAGALYDTSIPALIAVTAVMQALAVIAFAVLAPWPSTRHSRR